MPRQTSDQQPDHRHLDERFAGLDLSLVVLAHSPVARNPTECAFHDPTARHPTSATGAWSTLPHFQFPFTCRLTPGRQLLSAIGCISPDLCRDAAQNTSVLQADSERLWYRAYRRE